jgi:hypothetical protein
MIIFCGIIIYWEIAKSLIILNIKYRFIISNNFIRDNILIILISNDKEMHKTKLLIKLNMP